MSIKHRPGTGIDIWCRLFFQPLVSSQVAPVSSIERWLVSVAAPSSPWLDSHHYADPQVEPWGGNKYIFPGTEQPIHPKSE